MIEATPRIIAERNGLRVVHKFREQRLWEGGSDVTLERVSSDAMGNQTWIPVEGWYLSPEPRHKTWGGNSVDHLSIVLNMLLTNFDVVHDK